MHGQQYIKTISYVFPQQNPVCISPSLHEEWNPIVSRHTLIVTHEEHLAIS